MNRREEKMANRKKAMKENTAKAPERIKPPVQPPVQPPVFTDSRSRITYRESSARENVPASAVEASSFQRGVEEGYRRAKQEFLNELSYNKGVLNVITIAENYLAGTLGLKSRQDLAECGKVPSWWIVTLMSDIWYKNPEK